MKYTKNHTVYYNEKGEEVPSVTTILKILNKPSLIGWSNYLGLTGRRVEKELSDSSIKGTIVHERIRAFLNESLIINIWSCKEELIYVKKCMNNFLSWYTSHTVNPIFTEKSFSCPDFGGTIDFYGVVDNMYTIIDYKTSKKIRFSMFLQLALYCIMLEYYFHPVDQVGIVLVGDLYQDNKFISRTELIPYIDIAYTLIELFHKYFDLNATDLWNENII